MKESSLVLVSKEPVGGTDLEKAMSFNAGSDGKKSRICSDHCGRDDGSGSAEEKPGRAPVCCCASK